MDVEFTKVCREFVRAIKGTSLCSIGEAKARLEWMLLKQGLFSIRPGGAKSIRKRKHKRENLQAHEIRLKTLKRHFNKFEDTIQSRCLKSLGPSKYEGKRLAKSFEKRKSY